MLSEGASLAFAERINSVARLHRFSGLSFLGLNDGR
jgi:hypothetical protein